MSNYLCSQVLRSSRCIIPLLRTNSVRSNSLLFVNKHRTMWTFCEETIHRCLHENNYKSTFKPLFKRVYLSLNASSQRVWNRSMMKRSSPKREESFKIKDGVPSDYSLIYRAPMSVYLAVVQGISTASLILLFGGTVYNVAIGNTQFSSLPSKIGNIFESNEELLLFGVSLLVLSLGLTLFVAKYPVRIYNSEGLYISIFNSYLGIPLLRRAISFQKGDVTHLKPKGVLPWRDARYRINNKEVILLDDFFRKPADLHKMMDKC